jgi:hypothetical protein
MFCPEHHKELKTQHLKQQIQIKFMTIDRDAYLAAKKSKEKTAENDSLERVPMRVLGMMCDVDLAALCGSIPVSEGGFAQRNVASQHASIIEQSIRTDGYMLLAGNLALTELPYSEDEIKELKENKLLPEDFVPPQPLRDMKMQTRVGAWLLNFRDPNLRMGIRRFAIIDGNNRVIAIVRISAGDAAFLENTPLNAYLVDLPIHDGLAVQLASMKCNRLSHQNIEDTIGDTIQQYKNVIRVYEKLNPPKEDQKKKKGKRPQDKVADIVKWIMDNGQELVHLLPAGIKDKKGDLKKDAIAARIRLAKKASLEVMKWIQTKFALHQGKKEEMSKGLLRVLSHHYLKMDVVWEQPSPQEYIKARGEQVQLGIDLQSASKNWKGDRRERLVEFMSYGDGPMRCAAAVMAARPRLSEILRTQLSSLATQHGNDKDLADLLPVPIDDFQEHRLVKALHKMEQGGYDFDIYCMLWANAKTEGSQSASRSSKTKLIFPAYTSAEFDVTIMPKTVQDAYRELCLSMSKVEIERARAKKEADKLAEIAAKVAAAKKAAEEEFEKAKQEADAKAKAMVVADKVMDIVVPPAGRATRRSSAKKPRRSPATKLRKQLRKQPKRNTRRY